MAAAYQEMAEKKMDPVGKADADIDNDGDVDSSDKYLHNRRKAIKKSMKKDNGEKATMNPKMSDDKSEQKEEVEVDEALKPYDKNADFRVVNRLKPKQRTGTLSPAEKKQLANAQARLRNHGVTESFRDKLLSVIERKDHGKVDNKQEYDDNWSPGAKQMAKDHAPEVQADGQKAADETAANIAKSVKAAPGRSNDNQSGDKNIINPPEDVTKKAGFKEMLQSIANAYKGMK